jgi:acyl carrier protein
MDIRETVRAFIIDNFLFGDAGELENETSFLDNGVIDSTGMLELITYLEEYFNIRIEDEEMLPENMDSLNNVTAFLERKKGLQG